MKLNALRIAVSVAIVTIGASFAACGIDESGLLGDDASNGVDVITTGDGAPDVIIDVVPNDGIPPPPSCSTDASADVSCIPPVPLGWEPIAFQKNGNVGCGDDGGNFLGVQYLTQPTINKTSCVCSNCVADGGWSCGATIYSGATCSAETLDASATACFQSNHQSFGGWLTRYGSPACGGGTALGDNSADATAVSACYPTQCASDFCGLASSGFGLCIANAAVTDGGCPSGFPNAHVVGNSAHTACESCQSCALGNASAQCTGTVSAYNSGDCSGSSVQTVTANSTCNGSTTNPYSSLGYEAGPPPSPFCGPTKLPSGAPYLNGPFTICCP